MKKYKCSSIRFDRDLKDKDIDEIFDNADLAALRENIEGGVPFAQTEFKAVHSDEYLYLSYFAADSDIVSKFEKFNDLLYLEDVCEIFITADGINSYFEYEFSPNGVMFLGKIGFTESGEKTLTMIESSSAETLAFKTDGGYRIYAKINMNEFGYACGKQIMFNVHRVDYFTNSKRIELYSLNPTLKSLFHNKESLIPMDME